jgi:hypothetical protein
MSHDSFGAYSPHWTIPGSRRPQKPPTEANPGPGQYNVPAHERDLRYPPVIGTRQGRDYSTLTSSVELVQLPGMPEKCPQSIGPLDGVRFYMPMPVSPAPSFVPGPSGGSKKVTIGPKRKDEPVNPAPGPGTYSPQNGFAAPMHKFPQMQEREIFSEPPDTPGPGAYEVIPQLAKPPRWAEKLRVRTRGMEERAATRLRPWSQSSRESR